MAYIRRVGCIQFDPLNVVGTNPELVLQSRIDGLDQSMLGELLYEDRKLIDYWDKMMSIFLIEDWPYFARSRGRHQAWCTANQASVDPIYAEIEERGVVCSGDLDYGEKVSWAWGPTRLSRAALEGLYHAGHLVIHHKVKTRKYYDLAKRVLPPDLYGLADPFETEEQYHDWHVLRRIGSVGLLWNRPSDAWLGILGMKTRERHAAFARLLAARRITEVRVEGLEHPLYARTEDVPLLERGMTEEPAVRRASILAPLDNLLWDRKLVQELFGFEYRWEVYKPAAERKYGYYVLPVLDGDRLVARFEPVHHKAGKPLTIKQWWWEEGVVVDEGLRERVQQSLERLASFLGTGYARQEL
ncbi:hypothetical protein J31TS4_22760 [Paenibacillus sp. J31TS4]|nr:hypothetical protein J31TS4_22760 [Paenibacillus sp. J31TS4]